MISEIEMEITVDRSEMMQELRPGAARYGNDLERRSEKKQLLVGTELCPIYENDVDKTRFCGLDIFCPCPRWSKNADPPNFDFEKIIFWPVL